MTKADRKQALSVMVAAFAVAAGVWVGAATQAPPANAPVKFEEASIRPCDPDNLPPVPEGQRGGGANSFQMTPGRTHAQCMTLATLIRTAYGYGPVDLDAINPGGRGRGLGMNNLYGLGVEDGRRVRGGPDWVRSDRYSLDAIAAEASDAASMSGPMLRALLEQRFGLKVHIETEQIPAVALGIAPGGLKIRPVADGSCERQPPIPPGQPIRSTPDGVFVGNPPVLLFKPASVDEVRRGAKPQCGISIRPNGPNLVMVTGEATLEAIGRGLVGGPGKPQVFDRTDNKDKFNLVLEFASNRDFPPGLVQAAAGPVEPAPDANVVLEQIGLRLGPAQAPRDFIVIDTVQRPSAN
jgi:uncharacterized protein (TIGR03435 family)